MAVKAEPDVIVHARKRLWEKRLKLKELKAFGFGLSTLTLAVFSSKDVLIAVGGRQEQ